MSVEFLRADVLKNVHGRLIDTYGGLAGVRDENALKAAIGQPKNLQAHGEVESDRCARCLRLVGAHQGTRFQRWQQTDCICGPGDVSDLNGYRLSCSQVEETAMVLRAAASEIDEAGWTAWVESVVASL